MKLDVFANVEWVGTLKYSEAITRSHMIINHSTLIFMKVQAIINITESIATWRINYRQITAHFIPHYLYLFQ